MTAFIHTQTADSEPSANRGGQTRLHSLHSHCGPALSLAALGMALFFTNHWFAAVDDECAIIDRAAQPVLQTIRLYLHGTGEHEHPPLYDLILHGWLQLTHGNQHLLRLPAIVFYVVGAWVLAMAVGRRAGNAGLNYAALLIVLWPFGFHFGRLATWYSLCFFLVSLVTWSYFRYLEAPCLSTWLWLTGCSILLVYSNYFGWVVLFFVALDYRIEQRKSSARTWGAFCGTCLLLLMSYLPVMPAFLGELQAGTQPTANLLKLSLSGFYGLYSVFISESVAPWFWRVSLPAATAIGACLLITLSAIRGQERRFLVYFLAMVAAMAMLGIANTKRMLFISPWLILAVALALARCRTGIRRRMLWAVLTFIGVVGWFGIFSRQLYAAPHWVEPWERVAQAAATTARNRGIVIGNNPSFFFYLTYELPPPENERVRRFHGLLPNSIRRINAYNAAQWRDAGRPLGPEVRLVTGPHFQIPNAPMDEAEQWLTARCRLGNRERLVYDAGAGLKQRFSPDTGQTSWRIEIVTFDCR